MLNDFDEEAVSFSLDGLKEGSAGVDSRHRLSSGFRDTGPLGLEKRRQHVNPSGLHTKALSLETGATGLRTSFCDLFGEFVDAAFQEADQRSGISALTGGITRDTLGDVTGAIVGIVMGSGLIQPLLGHGNQGSPVVSWPPRPLAAHCEPLRRLGRDAERSSHVVVGQPARRVAHVTPGDVASGAARAVTHGTAGDGAPTLQ